MRSTCNLPLSAREATLASRFGNFGEVETPKWPDARGAFVEMQESADAQRATGALNLSELDGGGWCAFISRSAALRGSTHEPVRRSVTQGEIPMKRAIRSCARTVALPLVLALATGTLTYNLTAQTSGRGARQRHRAALRRRLGMRPRLPQNRWTLRSGGGARERLPRLLRQRLRVRALVPEEGRRMRSLSDPPNAYDDGSSYGRGWLCEQGYREIDSACVAIAVPANAFAVDFGDGWKCERGFREISGSCEAVIVPVNARLDSTGERWTCRRGYAAIGEQCAAVEVPANASLNSAGTSWRCERGFKSDGTTCVALQVPTNAHIDFSGNEWACNERYRRTGSTCTAGAAR